MSEFFRKPVRTIKRAFDRIFGFEAMRRFQAEIDRYHKNVEALTSENRDLKEQCEGLEDIIYKGEKKVGELEALNATLKSKLNECVNHALDWETKAGRLEESLLDAGMKVDRVQVGLDDRDAAIKHALSVCRDTQTKLYDLDSAFLRDAGEWTVQTRSMRQELDAVIQTLYNLGQNS